jgi:two-component system cell cycle sensor histidine kinase/response regulator CckA
VATKNRIDLQDVRRHERACVAVARVASSIIFLLGAAGLLGWIADVEFLVRPAYSLSPMSAGTAILLCLVAVSIPLLAPSGGRKGRWAATLLGAALLLFGAWTLLSYAGRTTMPTDAWLLNRAAAAGLAQGRNRMSPVSAVCFTLFGTAALSGAFGKRADLVCHTAAAAGLLLALVSVIGYLYSVASLVALQEYKPIAPQTAAAFFLSFLSLFLVRPGTGLMQTLLSPDSGGVLARRLLLFVVALPVLLGGIASVGMTSGVLTGPTSIFFLTAATDLSLTGLLLFNAFTINRFERGRREAQRSLVESERAYRTLFESAADPMFLVDDALLIMEANAAAAICLGRSAAEMKGRPMPEFAPACAQQVREELRRAFSDGHASFESCGRTPDGCDVPLEINARAVEIRGCPAVLTIARDLSERRRAQRVLAEKDAQLRQAQKMEAIGRLAGGIAHDFNNLLTVILGYAEIILGKLGAEHEARQDAFEIKMCAARAAALTRQLLVFSRRQPAAPRTTDLNAVLSEMTPLLSRLIGETIRLQIFVNAGCPFIRIDPSQLEQVILNLAVNARDAMPEGGTLVIESADRVVDGDLIPFTPTPAVGDYVQLSVRDTGTGIPQEVEPHIFEPFFTTKSELQGTGLGLSTVYGIVTQNGGAIGVETSPRTGTTMRILLPLAPAASPAELETRHEIRAGAERGSLLLVEDDPSVRAYLCLGLRRMGYHILEAASAEHALRIVERHAGEIDLVVSDVVMPGMGGPGLARELMNRIPGLRILFMSGYDDAGGRSVGSLCGRFDLITKPFTVTDLAARIAETSAAQPASAVPREGAGAGEQGRSVSPGRA